jgi:hypothetical protein
MTTRTIFRINLGLLLRWIVKLGRIDIQNAIFVALARQGRIPYS